MSNGNNTPTSVANNGQSMGSPWYSGYPTNPGNAGGPNSVTRTPGAMNDMVPSNTTTPGAESPSATNEAVAPPPAANQDSNRSPVTSDYNPLKAEKEGKAREVGSQAVWSLSSCKPGFGVDQLRDDSLETYWQSDGPQPHLVNIQFRKKTAVRDVCIYADYKQDESYTPSRISIRAGNHFNDLQEIESIDLQEPTGWTFIPLQTLLQSSDASSLSKPLRTFMVQIAVLSNHQNGRDTHMRQIKIFAPVDGVGVGVGVGGVAVGMSPIAHSAFTTNEFSQFSCIR